MDRLGEEVHLLSACVAMLEVSSTPFESLEIEGSGFGALVQRKRTCHIRGLKQLLCGPW